MQVRELQLTLAGAQAAVDGAHRLPVLRIWTGHSGHPDPPAGVARPADAGRQLPGHLRMHRPDPRHPQCSGNDGGARLRSTRSSDLPTVPAALESAAHPSAGADAPGRGMRASTSAERRHLALG